MPGISAILTAAGESTRMGRPKPLLPWCGATLIEYQIAGLLEAGVAEVVAVLGHRADDIKPYVHGLNVKHTTNPDYRSGKTTSVKAGLKAITEDADDILLLAVDQPRPARLIREVIQSHVSRRALISSPRYQGRGGHPVIFSGVLRSEMEAISEQTEGLRAVFRAHEDEVNSVHIDDPQIRLDLNTYADYERAKPVYGT
ncbi:MAG: nucleotidyltransferase family protein [SAR202 cluster bacterium]|nr:nucleotidyltransferase family protein [SAR202 cluster bacterium]